MTKKTNAGRKSKYYSDVKPRFDEIAEWCKLGATDKEIADNLGIHKGTFCEYKNRYPELNEFIKKSRKNPVITIKAALYKRAIGFQYSEIKTIKDNEGYERQETVVKTALPDPASAMILLKHWDKEGGWTNDPQSLEIRKKELELKEKQVEEW